MTKTVPLCRRCCGIFILAVLTAFSVRAEVPDSLSAEASEAWADAYEAKGEYQSALAYARVALSSQSSKDDIGAYRRNCEKVISLLMRLGDYKEALRYCRVLRLKLEKAKAPESMGASLDRMEAVAYREFGQKSLADSLMAESVRLFSIGDERHGLDGLAENYKLMAAWAGEDKDYSRSIEYADLWLRELELVTDVPAGRLAKESALANLSAAVAAAEAGLGSRAATYYDAARTAPGGDFENDPEYYLLAARYNLLSGDEEYAMNILTRLSSSSSANGRFRLEALRLMSGVAESRKDYREALALSEKACGLEDSLFRAWKLDNALQLSAFYKERELRGEIVGNEVKIRFQRVVILFAFLLVALLSALVGFALMSNKAIKRKNLAMAKLIEEYRDVEKTVSASNPEKAPEEETSVVSAAPDCGTEADRADYMALRDLVRRERLFLDPNLTRDRAVQLSGMNRNRLAKVVQEYSGTNFSGFINLMRLEYSLALLEKSDSTVETVALDSGFGNVRTYHRLFKERFGMTPTEYREASARLRGKSGQGVPGALAIIACLFLAMPSAVHAQERSYMEQLSVDEGLPHTDVSAIVQDADGYIWIGTYSGLCRYDGNSMTVWDMSNSILESSRIRSLFLSDDGLLYIGTETGGLTIFNTMEDRFVKTLRVPSNYVNSISLSPDGHSVLICTDDGLSELSLGDSTCDLSSLSFGGEVSGYETYRYYKGNTLLRS